MKRKESILSKMLWIIIGIQAAILVIVLLAFRVDNMIVATDDVSSFNDGWVLTDPDGNQTALSTLPYDGRSPAGAQYILSNTLPKEFEGKTLRFLSADQIICVYVDDVLIYTFGTDDTRLFGHTPGSVMNFVDLPEEFSEGKIEIYISSPYDNYATRYTQMEIGDRDVVILGLLKGNLLELILCMILVFASVILAILSLIQRVTKQDTYGMIYMVVCLLCCAVYGAIETKTLSIFYGNQTIYSFLIFFVLQLIPICLQTYYARLLPNPFKRRFECLLVISSVNAIVQLLLQVTNAEDLMNLAAISHFLIFLTGLVILVTLLWLILYRDKDGHALMDEFSRAVLKYEFVAVFALVAGSVVDIIRNYVIFIGDFGTYLRIGSVVFALFMITADIIRVAHVYASSITDNAALIEQQMVQVEKQNALLIQARDEAESAKAKAQEASEAKSSFLANMSHEIRTPINAVLGMDTMILKECKDDAILEHAKDIQIAGQSLLALVNDILDFSKIESGKMEIVETQYDLGSLINDSYYMVEQRAKEKGLKLEVYNKEDLPRLLYGDEIRIRQIVTNLLTNAVKYTKEGMVTLSVSYERKAKDQINLQVSVKDTGIGIAPENQAKLFDSFQRFDQNKNRNIEGSGLGLAITRQLLDLMGGTITVKSEYQKGSTFSVCIPQKVLSNQPIGTFYKRYDKVENSKEQEKSIWCAPDAQILVVDDVKMNLKVFTGLLRETQIKIETAISGVECLELTRKKKYDVIFLDHMMPAMDGVETLEKMNADENCLNHQTPVIMLTANAIVGAREEYLRKGFTDYLSKPVQPEDLTQMLFKYLPEHLIIGDKNNAAKKEEQTMSKLEQLSFLNTESGMNYCINDEQLYFETLADYLDESKVEELEKFYADQNWKDYQISIHAVKSTSRMIGADALSEHAKELEFALKDDNPQIVIEKHADVMREYADMLAKIKAVVEE